MGNYQIRKIDEHTWQLADPFRTYLYLVEGTKRAVLIDAGNGFSGLEETVASLTDKPVFTVLTHGHFDHTGAAAAFPPCCLHEADIPVLESGFDREMRAYQVERFAELYHVDLPPQEKEFLINAKQPERLCPIQESEQIMLGDRALDVIWTPGHTRGSICLLDQKHGYLFSGDTVCNREILVYFDHSTSVEDVKNSANKLLIWDENFREIWPGHHECPLDASYIRDYYQAAEDILKNPEIGTKIMLDNGYKLLYNYKSIGISYTESHIYQSKCE
ncbi:MAG: MBL fold metallo-hydrolase [Eubacteriales bacterium]|nr:MBL fold metallo-hydrolase [Eubacteriales bacterium]